MRRVDQKIKDGFFEVAASLALLWAFAPDGFPYTAGKYWMVRFEQGVLRGCAPFMG